MKVTRYFQSCLLIEEGSARILIDPSGQEKGHIGKMGRLDAVLYTHEHSDHFDAEMAQTFVEQGIAPVYANASTAKLIKASKTIVKDGQEFKINGVRVKVIELPHCLMPDGTQGPQNVGYLINDKLFHPGDGKELDGLRIDNLALPIIGPDISIKDAFAFAKQISAKAVIPIHYDFLGLKPEIVKSFAERFEMPFKVHILKNGQSVEL
jgi:L-ascorbate metabolism protein UlaG (beta-lactamase superfamily)